MTVGAKQRQVCEASPPLAGFVQRDDMVAFDIPTTEPAVGALEVEAAHLAGKSTSISLRRCDLPVTRRAIALTCQMPTRQEASFAGADLIEIERVHHGEVAELSRIDTLADAGCGLVHLYGVLDELVENLAVETAAFGWSPWIVVMDRGQIGGLT